MGTQIPLTSRSLQLGALGSHEKLSHDAFLFFLRQEYPWRQNRQSRTTKFLTETVERQNRPIIDKGKNDLDVDIFPAWNIMVSAKIVALPICPFSKQKLQSSTSKSLMSGPPCLSQIWSMTWSSLRKRVSAYTGLQQDRQAQKAKGQKKGRCNTEKYLKKNGAMISPSAKDYQIQSDHENDALL